MVTPVVRSSLLNGKELLRGLPITLLTSSFSTRASLKSVMWTLVALHKSFQVMMYVAYGMAVALPFRLLRHQVPMDGRKVAHRMPEFTPPCEQKNRHTAYARGRNPGASHSTCSNSCLRYLSTFLAACHHLLSPLTSHKPHHPLIPPACGQYGAGNSVGRVILYHCGYLVLRFLVLYPSPCLLLGFTLLCSQRSAEFAKRFPYDAPHYGPSLILFTTYHIVIKIALDSRPSHLPICGEYAKGSLGESQVRANRWLITSEYASEAPQNSMEQRGMTIHARLILAILAIFWRVGALALSSS